MRSKLVSEYIPRPIFTFALAWAVVLLVYALIAGGGLYYFSEVAVKEVDAAIPWYNQSWLRRKKVIVNPSVVSGGSNLSDFIYLVDITDADLIGDVRSDGFDLLFTGGDGTTKLNHEIEVWNSSTGRVLAWVYIPTLYATQNTTIYLYYKNSAAANQQNAPGLWAGYQVVVHGNSGNTLINSAGLPNHLTKTTTNPAATITGPINNALDFSGAENYASASNITPPGPTGSGTQYDWVSYWIRYDSTSTGEEHVFGLSGRLDWRVNNAGNGNAIVNFDLGGNGSFGYDSATTNWGTTNWYYITAVRAVTITTVNYTVYVNGAVNNTGLIGIGNVNAALFHLGIVQKNGQQRPFTGKVDEIRQTSSSINTITAGRVMTEYNNQLSPTTYTTTSPEETVNDFGWSPDGYLYRKQITIDNADVFGTGSHTNFPWLVDYTDTDVRDNNLEGEGDFYFTAADGVTPLDFEIDEYNASTGALIAWVTIPSLSTSVDTSIYMYYGNTNTGIDVQSGADTFDDYDWVLHLDDDTICNGTIGVDTYCDDSTDNNDDEFAFTGGGPAAWISSVIGTGADAGASNHFAGNPNYVDASGDFTVSAWINTSNTVAVADYLQGGNLFFMREFATYPGCTNNRVLISWGTSTVCNAVFVTDGTWHYITYVSNGSNVSYYQNGILRSSFTKTGTPSTTSGFVHRVGGASDNVDVDEYRFVRSARSEDWIDTEYGNQLNPGNTFTVGTQEANPGGTASTVSTSGTQTAIVDKGATNFYIGAPFVINSNYTYRNINAITIEETGTIDAATEISSVRIFYDLDTTAPYDCAGETYSGSESTFGTANRSGNRFTYYQIVQVSTTQTFCGYVVMDVAVGTTTADTIEFQITTPGTDVELSGGSAGPASAVALAGTTTVYSVGIVASATGSLSTVPYANDQNIGGKFIFNANGTSGAGQAQNITSVTFTETNSATDASTDISSVRMYYEFDTGSPFDCASETYGGTETQFGTAGTFSGANGTVTFSGTMSFNGSNTIACVYLVINNTNTTAGSINFDIQIANPNTNIVSNNYAVTPTSAIQPTGPGILEANVSNSAPSVSSVSLNGGSDINLTEGTTTSISVTGTITDADGFADIASANGVIYLSTAGSSCSFSEQSCYIVASCGLSGCAGNSCTATCSANIWFFATPTDTGATNWLGRINAIDGSALTGNGTSSAVELLTLRGLSIIEADIDYGSLQAGQNTGAVNETVTIRNTGNSAIDLELSGTNLCSDFPTCSGSQIAVGNMEYSTGAFSFGGGTDLTTVATAVDFSLNPTTSSISNSEAPIYWGLLVPGGTLAGNHTGSNTIQSTVDN